MRLYVNHSMSAPSNPETTPIISPETEHLLQLLKRWPRQRLSRWLLENGDIEDKLIARRVPEDLKRRPVKQDGFAAPAEDSDIGVIGYIDNLYPPLLRHIPDPPLLLFYRGSIRALSEIGIAIIGARRCTTNGKFMAQRMAADLAVRKVCVISGLALGIDTAAHLGALGQGGTTVAFLGCGVDRIYPSSNKRLAQQVVDQGGALVSEYALQTPPLAHHFPERNRLISGASAAVIVIEASEKSGSLITARMALEQGRDVFAMPGPVTSEVSRGCHRLIQQGAGLVLSVEDVLADMPGLDQVHADFAPGQQETPLPSDLSDVAAQVLEHITGYGQDLDEISTRVRQSAHATSLALVELELAGFVRQGGDGYIRAS